MFILLAVIDYCDSENDQICALYLLVYNIILVFLGGHLLSDTSDASLTVWALSSCTSSKANK